MAQQKKGSQKGIVLALIILAGLQLGFIGQSSLSSLHPANHIIVAEEIIPPNGGKH